MTAVVLGMARAFGEALAVQMVIGNTRVLPESLFDTAGTLTTIITLNIGTPHTEVLKTIRCGQWGLCFW